MILCSLDQILKILDRSRFVSKISLKKDCGLILIKARGLFVKQLCCMML
jgi:hypothetical protein